MLRYWKIYKDLLFRRTKSGMFCSNVMYYTSTFCWRAGPSLQSYSGRFLNWKIWVSYGTIVFITHESSGSWMKMDSPCLGNKIFAYDTGNYLFLCNERMPVASSFEIAAYVAGIVRGATSGDILRYTWTDKFSLSYDYFFGKFNLLFLRKQFSWLCILW